VRSGEGDGPPSDTAGVSAREVALSVLRRVLRGAFLAPALRRQLDATGLPGRERSFVTDLTYGTVRYLARLDAALAPRLRAPERLPEAARAALRLAAYELLVRGTPRHAAVHAWVEVVKAHEPRLAGLANAVLRRVRPPPGLEPEARLALPAWLLARFERALGAEAAERAAMAMLEPGPLWLRSYAADAEEALRAEGCLVEPGPLPATLAVRAPVPLDALAAYRQGKVQPQNPSSSLPAALLSPHPGERVLDLAAGNGVKTAQLAAAGASVVAVELDARKLRALTSNLARLGLAAESRVADLSQPALLPPASAVLLDAPCSGSGTLRGHPEIKLRLTPAEVEAAASRQRAMLETAAALLEPGGRLVYAVCSLTYLEGEGQIGDVVAARPELRAERVPAELLARVPHVVVPHGIYLLPLDGLDGFYLSLLRRA